MLAALLLPIEAAALHDPLPMDYTPKNWRELIRLKKKEAVLAKVFEDLPEAEQEALEEAIKPAKHENLPQIDWNALITRRESVNKILQAFANWQERENQDEEDLLRFLE